MIIIMLYIILKLILEVTMKNNLKKGKRMKIISFLNFKGGVGKTTSTHSIAAGLNLMGKNVLVIDMDPQGTLTFFSKGEKQLKGDTREVLFHEKTIGEAITNGQEFDFIGSNIKLATSEILLNNGYNKEQKLKKAIDKMSSNNKYDFILIDCPPSLSIFTLNALAASTDLIIPDLVKLFCNTP